MSIAPNSIFKGAIIAHDAIDILAGASLDGRAFSTNGGISTCGMSTTIPSNISSGPGNQTVCSGGSASFVITASGTGLTYQWRKGAVSLINGGNISGATTTTLTINPVSLSDAATNYNVIVTEPSLPTNTSANASLTVNPLPLPVITGLASGCTGSVEYSYTTAPGMTGYAWSVSAGGVITAGIASSEITVTWNTAGAKTISVNYTNASGCVAAVPSVFNVTVVPLPVPIITGPSSTCINSGYVNYSTESGMANYVWSVSAGGIINNGFGTNQVQVSWIGSGPQTVSVSYRNGVNCNVSLPTVYSVSVTNMPGQAGTITGTADVCAGTNGITYSVTPVLNASAYIWTLPSDAIISSGMGTNAITVDYGTNATSGTIQVNGNNVCGNGTSSPPLAVSVEPLPDLAGTITGPSSLCQGAASIEYVVDPISNATGYLWSVPTGATIVSGSNTNAITVDFSSIALSGPITVAGTNSCGTGPLVPAFFVSVNAIPATPIITITGNSLQSDSYTGNQWYMDGLPIYGATGQTWEAQQSGWYWDVVTLADCPSEASVHEYLVLVGEQELHAGNIDIYPVPNDGRFTVSIVSPTEEFFSISVFTKLGVQVLEINNIFVNKHVNQIIDMSSAESGIYSILIRNSSNNIVKKVVISR